MTNGLPPDPTETSYDPIYFAPISEVEDRHFWFRSRRRMIAALSRQIASGRRGFRILDAGCGTGSVLHAMQAACPDGRAFGMDLFHEGLTHAASPQLGRLVQGDVFQPPFSECFDLIGVFDVIEHLSEDTRALRSLHNLLARGGILLLTVPACMSLWSYFDEAAHHRRRYETEELRAKLTSTGFDVEYLSPCMSALFPFVWLYRKLWAAGRRKRPGSRRLDSQEFRIVPLLNGALSALLSAERRLIERRAVMPLGTSLIVVARKR